jgi:hypothetical protein
MKFHVSSRSGRGTLCLSDVALGLAEQSVRQGGGNRLQPGLEQQFGGNRHPAVALEDLLLRVTRVTGKDLVAAIAGEQVGDAVPAGQFRAVVGGQGGGIAEGLVVRFGDGSKARDDVLRRDVVLVAGAAEATVGDARVRELVVVGKSEADRKRAGRCRDDLAQHAGDGRTVEAAAQEGARRVARFGRAHRDAQRLVQSRVPGRGSRRAGPRRTRGSSTGRVAADRQSIRRRSPLAACERPRRSNPARAPCGRRGS